MARHLLTDCANTYPDHLRMECKLPHKIIAPCIITQIQPSAIFIPVDIVRALGGVPREFAFVFFTEIMKEV